jgi:hypothetical protein
LNDTHSSSSLDEAFGPYMRLEIDYTPQHGSWLDVAEIEQSALARHAEGT